jgi:hypothetical protein
MSVNEVKRTDGIELLRRDHRGCDALLMSLDQHDPDASTVNEIVRVLSVHDAAESACLYPLVETRLPEGIRLARADIEAHMHIAAILAEIDGRGADDPRRIELLADLNAAFQAHVVAQEATILGPLREHLAPEELFRLGSELEKAKSKAPTRPHPHVPRFSIGTRISAAALRPIDRVRDALSGRPR